MGILALPVMLLALWLYWRGRPIALDPADRLWRKLSQHFTRAHLGRYHGEGPTHYIRRLQSAYPLASQELEQLLERYVAIKYREESHEKTQIRGMKHLFKQIKRKSSAPRSG